MPLNESIDVTLGEHTFRALPQPHAFLLHHIPEIVFGLLQQTQGEDDATDLDANTVVALLGDAVYDLLNILLGRELKKRLPPWEFHGYQSKEAWDAGEFDEETARKTPTMPQITETLEALIRLNGGDVFRKMFGLLDPKPIRAAMSLRIADSISGGSLSSPPTSGGSGPTSSGEPSPTPEANGSVSPSLV